MWWRRGLVALVTLLAACSSGERSGQPTPDTAAEDTSDAPIALVVTEDGLAGVPVGSSEPRWVVEGAVAAPDGSAIYATTPTGTAQLDLVRVDPRTGSTRALGPLRRSLLGVHVAAVQPGGGRVALATKIGEHTEVMDVVLDEGVAQAKTTVFEGEVEPEAYSLDGTRLFGARIYADRYHVHVLDLATGEQFPTLGPDKALPPEDMWGTVVQAVLSPDGAQLATLYRDSSKPDHTAFVHLLDLAAGATVCIDLHEPFGTGEAGSDALTWSADGTVLVGHRGATAKASAAAAFDPAAIWSGSPQPHHHAEPRPDLGAAEIPDGVAATPGFLRFVAVAATT